MQNKNGLALGEINVALITISHRQLEKKCCLRLRLDSAEMFVSVFFLFFFHAFLRLAATVHCMNSSRKVGLFKLFSANQCTSYTIHGATNFTFQQLFSLKMGPTVLFTHLKIILLQYFSIFSCIQTNP